MMAQGASRFPASLALTQLVSWTGGVDESEPEVGNSSLHLLHSRLLERHSLHTILLVPITLFISLRLWKLTAKRGTNTPTQNISQTPTTPRILFSPAIATQTRVDRPQRLPQNPLVGAFQICAIWLTTRHHECNQTRQVCILRLGFPQNKGLN